jgi:hypothetical protein
VWIYAGEDDSRAYTTGMSQMADGEGRTDWPPPYEQFEADIDDKKGLQSCSETDPTYEATGPV